MILTAPAPPGYTETLVPKETLICVDSDVGFGGEGCRPGSDHSDKGSTRVCEAHTTAQTCERGSGSRHLDFLSFRIWNLKVRLISLVKLQGLSGVLVPQRERVFI